MFATGSLTLNLPTIEVLPADCFAVTFVVKDANGVIPSFISLDMTSLTLNIPNSELIKSTTVGTHDLNIVAEIDS